MYTNLNTGEIIPWQAESFTYNDDFTEITVKLRQGVTWSDGKRSARRTSSTRWRCCATTRPTCSTPRIYKEWLKSVDTPTP